MRIDISIRNCLERIERSKNKSELRTNLGEMLSIIQKGISLHLSDIRTNARVAQKGIQCYARSVDSQMAFICGQYAATIDSMIDMYKNDKYQAEINSVFASEVVRTIAIYLLKNKCSELQTVAKNIHIVAHDGGSVVYETVAVSSEDFEKAIVDMENVNIILRDYIGEREYIELSANGYTYMGRHYFEKEGFNLW